VTTKRYYLPQSSAVEQLKLTIPVRNPKLTLRLRRQNIAACSLWRTYAHNANYGFLASLTKARILALDMTTGSACAPCTWRRLGGFFFFCHFRAAFLGRVFEGWHAVFWGLTHHFSGYVAPSCHPPAPRSLSAGQKYDTVEYIQLNTNMIWASGCLEDTNTTGYEYDTIWI
jgi:hypothetical protein